MQLFPYGKIYNFMGLRLPAGIISLLLVIGSAVVLFVPGPVLGTDFKGGTEVEVAFGEPVTDEQIRNAVTQAGFSSPDVVRVNDDDFEHRFLIRVQEVSTIEEPQQREIERALCFGENLSAEECPEARQASEVKFSPGGEKITVRFRETPELDWVREQLSGGVGGITLRAGSNNVNMQNERENRVEVLLQSRGDQLMSGLQTAFGPEVVPDVPLRIEWVGPKAGAQLRDAAISSLLVALVFIMIYVAFRFDLRFAPGAVFSLAHDAFITLGVLVALRMEITLTTVAALLTIIGYSVNDTVVVFDRIRENFGKMRGANFTKIINVSLSETLSRTVLTSVTTIVSVSAFFVWGTGAVQDFALTLIIGMILGVYSSVFVALPITYWLDRVFFSKVAPKKERGPRAKKAEAVV